MAKSEDDYPGAILKLITCDGIRVKDGYKYPYCIAIKLLVISSAILGILLLYQILVYTYFRKFKGLDPRVIIMAISFAACVDLFLHYGMST
jgi:hypothetical protein